MAPKRLTFDHAKLCEAVKSYRLAVGLNKSAMANILGQPPSKYALLERGYRHSPELPYQFSLDMVLMVCYTLGLDLWDYVLGLPKLTLPTKK